METRLAKKLLTIHNSPISGHKSGTIGLAPTELFSGDAPTKTKLLDGSHGRI